jgi:hypothetical protein
MSVLDVQTWPRWNVPGLVLTDGDVGLLRRVDCDILTQGLIGLIESSYHQGIPSFPEVQLKRTLKLSVLGRSNFRLGDRPESLPRCVQVRKKWVEKIRVDL